MLPIVKLPSKLQMTLYLIKEELKSRKLFHALREAGLDDCSNWRKRLACAFIGLDPSNAQDMRLLQISINLF